MKIILFISSYLLLVSSTSFANDYEFKNASYKEASKSESFVQFKMSSTKVGIFTTSFDGYVKNFKLQGQVENQQLKAGASIEFLVEDLDTDIDGRNEKMWDLCLDSKKHPKLSLVLTSDVLINDNEVIVPAKLYLRGYEKPVLLTVRGSKENHQIAFQMQGKLSLRELEIPDPSIAVASVKDEILVTSKIVITP
jgi:hypothetical protein